MFGLGQQELSILAWIALLSVASIVAALFHNKILQKNKPDSMPYIWGYFQAWSSIFTSLVLFIIGFFTVSDHGGGEIIFILIAAAFALTGIGIIRRTKWGWVFLGLMSISTVLALVINIVYAKNRWKEFSSDRKEDVPNKSGNYHRKIFWTGGTSGERKGPFSYKEIENQIVSGGISRATLVWKEGMADWLPASETELKSHFFVEPPPLPVQEKTLPWFSSNSLSMPNSKDCCKDNDHEVTIRTYPSGLVVHIDEKRIYGTTPVKTKLNLGTHLIQLYNEGGFIHAEEFNFQNQNEIVLNLENEASVLSIKPKKYLCLKCMQDFESKNKFCIKCGSPDFVVDK